MLSGELFNSTEFLSHFLYDTRLIHIHLWSTKRKICVFLILLQHLNCFFSFFEAPRGPWK